MLGMPRGTVALVPYSEDWPGLFREEADRLREALGEAALAIEHVGSTAVPGMWAKPIIDIDVAVADLDDWVRLVQPLADIGYQCVPHVHDEARRFFAKGPETLRTHHLHLVAVDGDEWHGPLLFRDTLRARPDIAARYSRLKQVLADRFPTDRASYTVCKGRFVQAVLRRARADAPEHNVHRSQGAEP